MVPTPTCSPRSLHTYAWVPIQSLAYQSDVHNSARQIQRGGRSNRLRTGRSNTGEQLRLKWLSILKGNCRCACITGCAAPPAHSFECCNCRLLLLRCLHSTELTKTRHCGLSAHSQVSARERHQPAELVFDRVGLLEASGTDGMI